MADATTATKPWPKLASANDITALWPINDSLIAIRFTLIRRVSVDWWITPAFVYFSLFFLHLPSRSYSLHNYLVSSSFSPSFLRVDIFIIHYSQSPFGTGYANSCRIYLLFDPYRICMPLSDLLYLPMPQYPLLLIWPRSIRTNLSWPPSWHCIIPICCPVPWRMRYIYMEYISSPERATLEKRTGWSYSQI